MEKKLRKDEASFEERAEVRQEESVPILDELKTYLKTHPHDPRMFMACCGELCAESLGPVDRFIKNGAVQIDNNLVENRIGLVVLDRKDYLFAGSHDVARDAAILYSLMSTCKLHGVNYVEWLKDVLERIPKTPKELLPTPCPATGRPNGRQNLRKRHSFPASGH